MSMYSTVAELLDAAAKGDETRVVLLHSAGDAFSAGNGLRDFLHNPPKSDNGPQVRSNRWGGHLRVDALLEKLPRQVRATTRITLIAPPTASLIPLAVVHFEYWRAVSFSLADFLAACFLFAIAVGFVFGAVPALLVASLYCAVFAANSGLLRLRPLIRGGIAGICGGLTSGTCFWEKFSNAWGIYGLVGALVMAALSLRAPQPAQLLEKGVRRSVGGFNQGTKTFRRAPDRLWHQARFVTLPEALGRTVSSEEMSGGGPSGAVSPAKDPRSFLKRRIVVKSPFHWKARRFSPRRHPELRHSDSLGVKRCRLAVCAAAARN